ncbi:hypothetical protein [Modestobacter sp. NPDC049651]|uniref:hypothetical protein n=1 Tax=unclassified Modestobacter TaxID=2643866 RepID=UPI0033F9F353
MSRVALGAVATGIVMVGTPGTASATTTGDITPMLDCYTYNSNGTYTVILGYTSTYVGRRNVPAGGTSNYSSPSKYNAVLPSNFDPGTRHAVIKVDVSAYEVNSGASWYLMGHQLNYLAAAQASGVCSPGTVLPAEGNGTGMAIGLVAAGAVGAVGLRRLRKRTTAAQAATPAA